MSFVTEKPPLSSPWYTAAIGRLSSPFGSLTSTRNWGRKRKRSNYWHTTQTV